MNENKARTVKFFSKTIIIGIIEIIIVVCSVYLSETYESMKKIIMVTAMVLILPLGSLVAILTWRFMKEDKEREKSK